MKIVNGIIYLEPGEKHPNTDKIDKKKKSHKYMEDRTTVRSGHCSKSQIRGLIQKGVRY